MKHTVAVDMDGVLARYDGWKGLDHIGEPLPGAVQFTKDISEFAEVLIYTTRCCEAMAGRSGYGAVMLKKIVKEWLDKHGFTYADIWVGQGKPMFSCIVDDRAASCRPQEYGEAAYTRALVLAEHLCNTSSKLDKDPKDNVAAVAK